VGADTWENGDAIRRHSYLDDVATFERIHHCLAVEGYRIAKPRAHLYLFCAFVNFAPLAKQFAAAGWEVWPRPLIWWRGSNSGIAPRPEHGPRNTYECILFANKGNRSVISLEPDVILAPKSGVDPRAAAKPPSIYHMLLARSVVAGNEVLDPCCGSGPVFPAATTLNVRATGYDVAEDAVGLASQRLQEKYEPVSTEVTVRSTVSRGGIRTKRGDV
jgi:hypothetical protein